MSFFSSCCGGSNKGDYYQVTREEDGKSKTEYYRDLKKAKNLDNAHRVIRVERSQYNDLIKKYKNGKLFTDSSFPPNEKSLGSIPNVPSDCKWERLSKILPNSQLYVDKIEPKDVIQGSLGDCYFLSALAALAEKQHRIRNVFGDQQFNPSGVYKCTLRIDGVIRQVVIDDYVPINKAGKPLFCQPHNNELWVLLIEKAWAKANGSYANITAGTPSEVLKAITLAPCQLRPIREGEQQNMDNQRNLWGDILIHAQKDNPMCAGTKTDESISWEDLGLVSGHAYTLLDAVTLQDEMNNEHRIVKLRNPWGQNQWRGSCNENDEDFWGQIQQTQDKIKFRRNHENGNDGIFYMNYNQFCHYFNEVHLCDMIDNPKYEVQKMYCDKKHGSLYTFDVKENQNYIIELHQDTIRGEDKEKMEAGVNRSTLLLAKGDDDYQFVDGSLKYHEEDNSLRVNLSPGKYYVFAKIDPTIQKNLIPDNLSVSCYSKNWVDITPTDRKKHPQFFQKVFLAYARTHKRKEYDEGKMWISWKLFFEKGGYAYLAFGVEPGHNRRFVIKLDEEDFTKSNYILKKPYKGKGKFQIQVKPGEQKVLVARVKNGPLEPMKFPPALDIQIEGA